MRFRVVEAMTASRGVFPGAPGTELGGDADRLEKIPVIRRAGAGDVERGPMARRGADERQADEQRHDRTEAEELDGT